VAELRLEVREFKDLTRWRWMLTDGAGRFVADHEVELDAGCWQYEAFTDLLGYLSWHVAPDSRADGEARAVAEVGAWIGESVLGPVAPALVAARPATVRVVVPEEARALLFRPLELGHANGKPLAVQDVTLVLQPETATGPAASGGGAAGVPDGGRLRVLGLFSLPEGGQTLNLRRERHSLVQLIRSVAASGKAADVRVLQYGVTRKRLQEMLEEAEGWDIIHISGHGAPGELLLEDARGKPDRVSADELADLLDLARERVKLVTVAACWSAALTAADQRRLLGLPAPDARADAPDSGSSDGGSPDGRSPDDGFAAGALATELTRRLGCAVLAMRYPVGDDFAIALSGKLYGLLAEKGQPLPRAVGMTLRQLADVATWPTLSLATPALFGCRAVGLRLAAPERQGPEEYDPVKLKMAGFPDQPARFVGRTGVMARASATLAAGSGIPGVLLHGMPGGGKTACALELAYTHEHAFDRLVWYKAPDEGMDTHGALTDFALTLERVLPAFQMAHLLADPARLTAFLPQLTELVEQRRVLIVIDNIESLLTSGGQWRDDQWGQVIAALSAHTGRGRLIVTTRRLPESTEAGGLRTVSVGG
jgi:CHAT domain/NB-ARC domain